MSQPGFAFQRVAIVNRGEPAMRFINAVREWNAEGRPALRVIAVYAEKLGQLADEFDGVHSIERARQVGSVQAIVPAAGLRPYLIDAVRRGMQRTPGLAADLGRHVSPTAGDA